MLFAKRNAISIPFQPNTCWPVKLIVLCKDEYRFYVNWNIDKFVECLLHLRSYHSILVDHCLSLVVRAFGLNCQDFGSQFANGILDLSSVNAEGASRRINLDCAFIEQIVELNRLPLTVCFIYTEPDRAKRTCKVGGVQIAFHCFVDQAMVHQILERPQPGDVSFRLFYCRVELFQLLSDAGVRARDFDVVRSETVHQFVSQYMGEECIKRYLRLLRRIHHHFGNWYQNLIEFGLLYVLEHYPL